MTYKFGRVLGLGTLPWHQSEVTGEMRGNPSVSQAVSAYMVSLRRRKVSCASSVIETVAHVVDEIQAGETAVSARAMTSVGGLLSLWATLRWLNISGPGNFEAHVPLQPPARQVGFAGLQAGQTWHEESG